VLVAHRASSFVIPPWFVMRRNDRVAKM